MKEENTRMTVVIPKWLVPAIKEEAQNQKRSMGQHIAYCLEKYHKVKHG